MDDVFVGRRAELAFLEARLREAGQGRPRVVLIEGSPGIGKTALLSAFLRRGPHCRMLRASGDEAETGLAYGLVEQLLADAGRPVPQTLAAVGAGAVPEASPLHVGAELVELLGRLQAGGLVTLAVDDLAWADTPSLQALTFALRRLRADRVLALLTVRTESADRLPGGLLRLVAGEHGARLRLAGLGNTEVRELSVAVGAGFLSAQAARRLRDHTEGNALHIRALFDELPADQLRASGATLPAPRSFRMLALRRLAACSPATERLVVAAAVLGGRCPLGLAGAVAGLDDPLPAFEEAVGARLLVEQDAATARLLVFQHPLVRAAVYQDLGPARRAAVHLRAAEVVDDEVAGLRHRLAAASGADEGLAAAATGLAARQGAAGAWAAAADLLLAAARVSGARRDREQRLLRAVECLLLAGSAAEAAAHAPELAGLEASIRRDYVLGLLALTEGRQADAERLLRASWDRGAQDGDGGEVAALAAGQLAFLAVTQARGEAAVTWAERAGAARVPGAGGLTNLLDLRVIGLGQAGRAHEGLRLTAALPDPWARPGPDGLDGWLGRGLVLLHTDALERARAHLAAALAGYRRRGGPAQFALPALTYLAETEFRLGAWDEAVVHSELAVSVAEDTDQTWLLALVHAVVALPLAARGQLGPAADHVHAARQALRPLGDASNTAYVARARALVAAARGHHQGVVDALEPLLGADLGGMDEPGVVAWREPLAEALARLGRHGEAEAVLAPLEELATVRGRRSSLLGAARARGTLEAARGNLERAGSAFRAGLAHGRGLLTPFDLALFDEAYGRFLRRAGQRSAAADRLGAAAERFAALGAAPFLARCERELAACGRAPARRQPGREVRLTPQELAVSRLIGRGLTNRQAAAELVVSVKTVEFHLGNVYAKLGVTSRSQLTARMAGADAVGLPVTAR